MFFKLLFFLLPILTSIVTEARSNGRYAHYVQQPQTPAPMIRMKRMHQQDCMFDICENVPNYPEKVVENIISKHKSLHTYFGGSIIEPSGFTAIGTRISNHAKPFCETSDISVTPREMKDIDGVTRIVANAGNYTQIIKYQLCSNKNNGGCYPGNTLDFETSCRQKYNDIKLVTVNTETNVLEYRKFRIPSTCVCVYTKTDY